MIAIPNGAKFDDRWEERWLSEDSEASEAALRAQVMQGVSQAPGFVAGYWTRKDNSGLSMVIFESEEAANGMSERVPGMVPDTVTLEEVEVREVVVHA